MSFLARFVPPCSVIEQDRAEHVLSAYLLPLQTHNGVPHLCSLFQHYMPRTLTYPPASLEAQSELCETPLSNALALVSTINPSTPTDTERRHIAEPKDKALNRVIHGKFLTLQVQTAHPGLKVHQQVE